MSKTTELYMCAKEAALIAAVVFLAFAMQGCRTMGKLGELTSAIGNDFTSVAESSEEAVRGYANGL